MKTKLILRTMGLLILMASLFMFSSCSKKTADGNLTKDQKDQQDKNLVASSIDPKDYTETDEDLTTVDYKEFYDQLAPHGEWVQVRPDEIGLKSKIASTESSSNNSRLLSNLLGIKDANASSDVDLGMVFAWSPSPDLSLTVAVGESHEYRPYRNGQWVNTNEGWYFRAPTPWEETVHHHGRWVHSPTAGWLWVPGRVWAPAWVNWRQNDDYVSWAPLPPSDYLDDGYMSDPQIDDDYYMIVERRHFIDPDIYRYDDRYYPRYDDNGDRIMVGVMAGTVGIVVVNNIIMDRGPDVNIIQNIYGRNIDMVNIHHVGNFKDARYSDKQYNVYTPDFKRYTSKDNTKFTVNQPKSFKNYADVRKESAGNDNVNKNVGKNNASNQKGNDNVSKQKSNNNVSKQKGNDNVSKQKSNNNVSKQKGNNNVSKQKSNNNVSKQKGNDNVSKQKSNNNVSKQKGNDNVSKQKGNDNGSKQKGNDNVSKQKGNDNGSNQKGNDNGKGKK
jgi:hypothetical protein